VSDEATVPKNRLADRLRTLRNSRPRPEEGKSMKDERGLKKKPFLKAHGNNMATRSLGKEIIFRN